MVKNGKVLQLMRPPKLPGAWPGVHYKDATQHNDTVDVVRIDATLARRIALYREREDFSIHRLPYIVTEALDLPGVQVWYEWVQGQHRYVAWAVFDAEHKTITGNRLEAALR